MGTIATLMLLAALLPYCAAVAAKAGGKSYDNDDPRAWLARQAGWRARANAAQANLFEGLPFFYGAVLFALYGQAVRGTLVGLMAAWVVVRILYIVIYVAGYGSLRTAVWGVALVLNIAILFSPQLFGLA
ncbi:hypothetical protein GSY71_00240 [Pusillimonas sp. TS35]|uniref:MAPEG family protein n=1 Tax=Paracandidimonas lactea TaxID=2895524 RepID=UPI00136C0B0E|nr:MAPEG family protein [Paracandidimonas lactea]MYN11587.1 hypothetical protein [Pusillimonas sp. TS35]